MDEALKTRISETIAQSRVVLFMKGSKHFPQCGFSAQVVQILKQKGADFKDVNILADAELRQGVKEYSNWPTFPQLFIHGELIGGCDITLELFESGELARMISETQRQ